MENKNRKQETELPLDEGQLHAYVVECRFLGLLMDPSVAKRLTGCSPSSGLVYVCVWGGGVPQKVNLLLQRPPFKCKLIYEKLTEIKRGQFSEHVRIIYKIIYSCSIYMYA